MTAEGNTIPEDIRERAILAVEKFRDAFIDATRSQNSGNVRSVAIDAVSKAILAERRRDQWEAIRSAPMDGSMMLVFGMDDAIGHVDNDFANVFEVACFEDWCEPEWVNADGEKLSFLPTHWMPLPEAPKGGPK